MTSSDDDSWVDAPEYLQNEYNSNPDDDFITEVFIRIPKLEYAEFLKTARYCPAGELCPQPWCQKCGFRDCPNSDKEHYSRTGCPTCHLLKLSN